jgi:YD repeat-containing protein
VAGNLSQIDRGPVASTFGYDKTNRLTSITHELPTATGSSVHTFAYDNASRIVDFNTDDAAYSTRHFVYDAAGQLVEKIGVATHEFYIYDDNGNRMEKNASPVSTALANRLTSDSAYIYSYDNEGNITRRTPLSGVSVANPVMVFAYARESSGERA